MSATKTLMTVEEFAAMQTADTEQYELVNGELVPLSSPTPKHGKIRRRLERALEDYFAGHRSGEVMGETDCRISAEIVRRPDLMVFLSERSGQIDEYKVPVPFAPDIAVEVVSPSESAVEIRRKEKEYLAGGCQEVWVLDHANAEMWIYSLNGGRLLPREAVLDTPLLPGFSVVVGDLLR